MNRARVAAALALAVLASSSCKRREEVVAPPLPKTVPRASTSAELPADRLAPGELAEGTADAFGVKLPRGFSIVRSFEDEISADGPSQPEQVANYLRRRVDAASVEIGPGSTVFVDARAKAHSERTLRIDVFGKRGGTEIVVRDRTPPAVEPGLSEEERWRRNGLKPNGEPLDPTKLR